MTTCRLRCSSSLSLQPFLSLQLCLCYNTPCAWIFPVVLARPSRYTSNAPFTWQIVVCVAALLCRYNLSSRYNSACVTTLPARDTLSFALQLFLFVTIFSVVLARPSRYTSNAPFTWQLVVCVAALLCRSNLSSRYNSACVTTLPARDTLSFALHLFLFVTIFSVVLARPSRYTSNAPFTWQLVVCVAALLCRYNLSSRYNSACVTTLPARDTMSFALQLFLFVTIFSVVLARPSRYTSNAPFKWQLVVCVAALLCRYNLSSRYNSACVTTLPARDTLSFALHLFLFVTIFSVVLARPSRYTSNAPFTWQLVVCVAALLCRYNLSSRYNSACVTTLPARDTLSFALQLFLFVTIFSVVLARPSRYTSNAPFTWQLVVCVAALLCRYNLSSRYNSACVTTLVYVATRLRYDFSSTLQLVFYVPAFLFRYSC